MVVPRNNTVILNAHSKWMDVVIISVVNSRKTIELTIIFKIQKCAHEVCKHTIFYIKKTCRIIGSFFFNRPEKYKGCALYLGVSLLYLLCKFQLTFKNTCNYI